MRGKRICPEIVCLSGERGCPYGGVPRACLVCPRRAAQGGAEPGLSGQGRGGVTSAPVGTPLTTALALLSGAPPRRRALRHHFASLIPLLVRGSRRVVRFSTRTSMGIEPGASAWQCSEEAPRPRLHPPVRRVRPAITCRPPHAAARPPPPCRDVWHRRGVVWAWAWLGRGVTPPAAAVTAQLGFALPDHGGNLQNRSPGVSGPNLVRDQAPALSEKVVKLRLFLPRTSRL